MKKSSEFHQVRLIYGRQELCADTVQTMLSEFVHPEIVWVKPSKSAYRKADLDDCFVRCSAARGKNDVLVVVLDRADLLNDSCANSLLKLLEEPPLGVYFILTALSVEFVLPTIVSRSLCQKLCDGGVSGFSHPLIEFFSDLEHATMQRLVQILEQNPVDEVMSRQIFDMVYVRWQNIYCKAQQDGDREFAVRAEKIVRSFTAALDRLPMPGSAPFFWKHLFFLVK